MHFTEDQSLTVVGILSAFFVLFFFVKLIRNQRSTPPKIPKSTHENKSHENKLADNSQRTQQEIAPILKESKFPWYQRLRIGLNQTHNQIIKNLDEFFLSKKEKSTREEVLEYLFELLIQADVGVSTSELLVEKVKNRLETADYNNPEKFKTILKEEILLILETLFENKQGTIEKPKHTPHVVLMVGVNGAGKTTTTGKLAFKSYLNQKSVIIGAADTFRAAAVEQLSIWADRAHAEMISLKEGVDPASVAYEATKKAAEQQD